MLLQVLDAGEAHPAGGALKGPVRAVWARPLRAASGRSNVELVGVLNIFQSKKQTRKGNQALILKLNKHFCRSALTEEKKEHFTIFKNSLCIRL